MKNIIKFASLLIFAVAVSTGCVTDNGKFPQPSANFTPKYTYSLPYDTLWNDVLNALDKNKITVAAIDKASGVIQSDYCAGPGTFMVIMAQSTRYKYNITVRDQGNGTMRVNIVCKIEDSVQGDQGANPYRDVTPQNTALATKLETWLYEQIEGEIK